MFTLPLPIFKWEALRDPDGNLYTTVIIGSQEWTVEPWRSTKYTDGTAIPNVKRRRQWERLSTGAYCWYDNDPSNGEIYGALYNWYAVDSGKLCPEGWRVPTDEDWSVLMDYLARPGSVRWSRGKFGGVDFYFIRLWWSATEGGDTNAYNRYMLSNYGSVFRNYYSKRNGFSVLCLRDN